jgi:anaerobic selenocysteine-containing dehydrogenase
LTYKANGVYTTVCPRDCFGSCTLDLRVEDGKVTKITGNGVNKNSAGTLCVKGASYVKQLAHPDRLKYPLLKDKKSGCFNRLSWTEALDLIKTHLVKHREAGSTESVMYINSWGHAGVFNDYANYFWSQYGPISVTYGDLCNGAGSLAMKYTYGNVVKHNNNADLENAKLIIVWGSNPANTNIHRMRHIKKAVEKGAQLIVIDPRVSETMIEGAVRIHPRGGTDALLAIGVAKRLIEKGLCDEKFIGAYVHGYEAYRDHVATYSMADILERTELTSEAIETLVAAIEKNPIYALITGTGKSRYSNGGQAERAVCILPALTGSIGLSGGGCYFTDNQTPKMTWPVLKEGLDCKMKARVHIGKLGQDLGRLKPGIKFLWLEKANPMTSWPNTTATRKAISDIDFTVVVDHFMTDTAKLADLVLPAAMFAEKDDLVSAYGDSYIHLLQKVVDPPYECKSEAEIFRDLGQTMGFDMEALPIVDAEFVTDFLAFNGINTDYQTLTKGPYLMEGYKDIAFEDRVFQTPSGKIEIYSEQMVQWNEAPLPSYKPLQEGEESNRGALRQYPLHLLTSHPKERINAQFIEMKLSPKHRVPEIEIHPVDAERRQINHGDLVRVYNDLGDLFIKADVRPSVKEGMVNLYEGWDEAHGACGNKLIFARETDIGRGTAYYDAWVQIEKA